MLTTPTLSTDRRNHERRGQAEACAPAVERLIRETHAVLSNCGVVMSPSKVSRLVRTYKNKVERNGFPFAAFIANNVELHAAQRLAVATELARRISYADPTGERASTNVDRERGVRYVS